MSVTSTISKAAAVQRANQLARMACVALCLVALPAHGAFAQTRTAPAPGSNVAPPLPAPQPLEAPPPYERQLLRLAEIIGALAWLTELCGDRPGDQWRQQMATLMDAEAATARRRERLAGSYNRGFRGYSAMHRRCTPSAQLVITRFLDEGGRIARDVANRFSG